jgi:RecJ-like exonuclease
LEINPLHYGIDGSYYVSGGGLSYFLAKEFNYKDLSWIGVLAAVGDMQNNRTGKLEGLNSIILKDSVYQGYVQSTNDLSLYGRQTRPLFTALSYFSDVNLPITNNKTESIALMKYLEIPRKTGDSFRTLSDLNNVEKGKLFSELVRMLLKEVPKRYAKYVPKLVAADSYEFMMEENHTFLRDASEFSTAMNACIRNNRDDIALKMLKGDRTSSIYEFELISKEYKRYLAQNIHKIEENSMIKTLGNIQYFNSDEIRSQVVGTIAGMVLSYGDWKKPMIGFTRISDEYDNLKVSLRCSRLLAYDGIHFGNITRKIAKSVGGYGGGHSVACGANIPLNKKDDFLMKLNNTLKEIL